VEPAVRSLHGRYDGVARQRSTIHEPDDIRLFGGTTMTTVSLGDLLLRQVALDWTEAVAVVAELCTVLTRDGGPDAPIPDPMLILLTAAGTVTIRSDGGGRSQRTTPGRLLHTLLASSDAPSSLRLFVSVGVSSDRYDSAAAFGEALAYYEAGGRAPLIQAAYQRGLTGSGVQAAGTPISVGLPEKASPPRRERQDVPTWAVAAGAAIVAGGVGVALWFFAVAPSARRASATPDELTMVADVPVVGRKAVETPGAGAPDSSPEARQRTSKDGSPLESPADNGPRVQLRDKSGYVPDSAVSPNGARTSTTAPREGPEPPGEPVYSSTSSDVQPPVPISALPPTGRYPNQDSTGIIELLVNEDGHVAHVRLVSYPSRVQPLMLLSAAKTWTFRPALRDGRPVKFRLRITVPSTLP
jgi:hypothetical protein